MTQAVRVELVGHDAAGCDHLWVGGVGDLCAAEPVRLALPTSERKDDGR